MNKQIKKVEEWFIERNINNADPSKQMLKLIEEVGELSAGLVRDDRHATLDGIGDSLVVLIGLCMQLDTTPLECLQIAYDEIKDRQGSVKNGIFVKEE